MSSSDLEEMTPAARQVFERALEVGRHWNAAEPDSDFTDEDLRRVEALALAVLLYDEGAL